MFAEIKKGLGIVLAVAIVLFIVLGAGNIWEKNKFGNFQVKQAFWTGTMSIRDEPGTYGQMWGDITTYQKGNMLYASKDKLDGGEGAMTGPMASSFMGNATGDVSSIMKYRMPSSEENRFGLHELYGSDEAVKIDLVRQAMAGAIKQAGPLFKPEEAWITKRADYQKLVRDMLEIGKFATKTYEVVVDRDGKQIKEQKTELLLDSVGNRIVLEESPLAKFGIIIEHFEIKDIDFDDKTDALIQAKKEAEQQQITLRAQSEKAKVEAIKAQEEGKKRVAEAEANALVAKKTATVEAEKKYEVAKFERMRSEEEAAAKLVRERAQAEANALKVKAGLTPQERAEWEYKTSVDQMKALAAGIANWDLPKVMVTGGGENGNSVDPIQALGIKSLIDISDHMAKQ